VPTLIRDAGVDVPAFDPTDPALHRDPGPLYRYLRERAPALELADGTWIVTRHADVARLLRSRAISSAQIGGDPGGPAATLAENGKHLILASDPPVHTRRRGAVAHRFTSHPVEALAPVVEAHVAHRLDDLAAALDRDGRADLVEVVCGRIPMDTLCSLLGLPPEAAPDLRRWTTALVDGLDPWADGAAADRAGAALDEVVAFLAPQLAARRADPRDDLVSVLATAPDLTPDEQLHNTVLFLNAGLDTSGDLLANAVARLLETPGAWAHLAADPAGRAAAVGEEVARYDSPVQFSMRRTVDPVEVAGSSVPAGRPLLLGLGAANRDPDVFDDPDSFVVDRADRRHLAFGGGAHLCLGAPVARLEAAVTLRELARRFPTLHLAGEAAWRPRLAFRGRAVVPVAATASPRSSPSAARLDGSSGVSPRRRSGLPGRGEPPAPGRCA
jgi:cytochrome P450